jgi:hypothetical protein
MTAAERQTLQNFINQDLSVSTYARSILRWLGEDVMFDDAYPYDIDRKAIVGDYYEPSRNDMRTDLLVYPNPSNGLFTAQVVTTVPDAECALIVTDLSGRELLNNTITAQRLETILDLRSFTNGMYLCFLKINGSITGTARLIKQ